MIIFFVMHIMENIRHGLLKSGSSIFETKWHALVGECAPRHNESSFILILLADLDLIIALKTIHEGKDLISGANVNDLIIKESGIIIHWPCLVEIVETMNTLMFPHFLFTKMSWMPMLYKGWDK